MLNEPLSSAYNSPIMIVLKHPHNYHYLDINLISNKKLSPIKDYYGEILKVSSSCCTLRKFKEYYIYSHNYIPKQILNAFYIK